MTVGQDSRWGYNSISGSPIKKRTPRSFRHKGVPLLQVIKKVHSVLFIKKEYLHRAARQTATDFCLSNKKTLWWLISSGPHWVRNPSFDRVEAPASANTTLLNISKNLTELQGCCTTSVPLNVQKMMSSVLLSPPLRKRTTACFFIWFSGA